MLGEGKGGSEVWTVSLHEIKESGCRSNTASPLLPVLKPLDYAKTDTKTRVYILVFEGLLLKKQLRSCIPSSSRYRVE